MEKTVDYYLDRNLFYGQKMNLNSYIKEDLQHRIQSGRTVPQPLTLANLSEHYGVSITPIRVALGELIQDGWICKHTNGRLAINPKKVGTKKTRKVIPCPKTQDDWDRIFIEDIMVVSLGRDASYLREKTLSEKHNIGRSVIRHTFSRFAASGLIEHVPRCGWLVYPLIIEDVWSYLEVREILELKALNLARPHLVRSDLEQILGGIRTAGKKGLYGLDNHLHDYLVDKSGNRYIRDFFRQHIAMYYTTLFHYAAPKTSVVAKMTDQHCSILEALIAHAWPRARQALAEHIQAQSSVLSSLLTRTKE